MYNSPFLQLPTSLTALVTQDSNAEEFSKVPIDDSAISSTPTCLLPPLKTTTPFSLAPFFLKRNLEVSLIPPLNMFAQVKEITSQDIPRLKLTLQSRIIPFKRRSYLGKRTWPHFLRSAFDTTNSHFIIHRPYSHRCFRVIENKVMSMKNPTSPALMAPIGLSTSFCRHAHS
ncbi:hypothetical protein VKT23_011108 [Stygiomarasmius scandens]|uniref:Uncharacterized protein n=1 Tax=Marasmiellus scandens TaxID=2682957 RepID=A0ABR1J9Y1_9AGAR